MPSPASFPPAQEPLCLSLHGWASESTSRGSQTRPPAGEKSQSQPFGVTPSSPIGVGTRIRSSGRIGKVHYKPAAGFHRGRVTRGRCGSSRSPAKSRITQDQDLHAKGLSLACGSVASEDTNQFASRAGFVQERRPSSSSPWVFHGGRAFSEVLPKPSSHSPSVPAEDFKHGLITRLRTHCAWFTLAICEVQGALLLLEPDRQGTGFFDLLQLDCIQSIIFISLQPSR